MLKNVIERRGGLNVTECMNLRPAPGTNDVLEPVGAPLKVADGDWLPLFSHHGRLLVTERDTLRIGFCIPGAPLPDGDPGVTVIDTLPGAPEAVYAEGDLITVMTGEGPWLMSATEAGFSVIGTAGNWPEIAVTATGGNVISHTIPAGTVADLAVSHVTAYRDIAETLGRTGQYLQPVMVRCRLLDADGRLLHLTPPVCVVPDYGPQLTETLHLEMNGEEVSGTTVEGRGFKLKVTIAGSVPAALASRVASIQALALPQFHCCDMMGKAAVTISRRGGASGAAVTANSVLPGLSAGLNAANLRRAFAMFDTSATEIAVIDRPFDADSPKEFVIDAPAVADVAADAATFRKALAARAVRISEGIARMSLPHTFSASVTAANGGRRVFSGLRRHAWRGFTAASFAAGTISENATVCKVKITMADGSVLQSTVTADFRPEKVGPVLSYPDARARRLTLQAGTLGISVDLQPDMSEAHAIWVAADGRPAALSSDFDTITGPDTVQAKDMPGMLAVTESGTVTHVCNPGMRVRAIVAARTAGSAWDFGRSRFYLLGPDGIHMLAVSGKALSTSLIDSRAVESALRVCPAGDSVFLLAGTNLLRLSGNRAASLPGLWNYDRLGFDEVRGELILANPDDNEAAAVNPDDSRLPSYTFPLVLPDASARAWLACGGKIYALTSDGTVCLTERHTVTTENICVRWSAVLTPARPEKTALSAVTIPVRASRIDGTFDVERAWLGRKALIFKFKIKGEVRTPLRCTLPVRPVLDLRMTLDASVSPDFRLVAPVLNL